VLEPGSPLAGVWSCPSILEYVPFNSTEYFVGFLGVLISGVILEELHPMDPRVRISGAAYCSNFPMGFYDF